MPSFHRLTFRRGGAPAARFAPDGRSILYAAAWDGDPVRIFSTQIKRPESARLDLPDAGIEAISSSSELLIMLGRHLGQFWETCTLAQVPIGEVRRVRSRMTSWEPTGVPGTIAVIRKVGNRFRLEYPIGHLLYESAGRPELAAGLAKRRARRVLGDEKGRMALSIVTGLARTNPHRQARVSDGTWCGHQQMMKCGSRHRDRAVGVPTSCGRRCLGKLRVLLRLPGTVYPQDLSTDGQRLIIGVGALRSVARCLPPGEDRERDLSWFGATTLRDLTPDGRIALISETVAGDPAGHRISYIRKTDGSPPVRLSETSPIVLSADGKWIVSQHEGGAFTVLPTGAGDPSPFDMKGFDWSSGVPRQQAPAALSWCAARGRRGVPHMTSRRARKRRSTPDGFCLPGWSVRGRKRSCCKTEEDDGSRATRGDGAMRPFPG